MTPWRWSPNTHSAPHGEELDAYYGPSGGARVSLVMTAEITNFTLHHSLLTLCQHCPLPFVLGGCFVFLRLIVTHREMLASPWHRVLRENRACCPAPSP